MEQTTEIQFDFCKISVVDKEIVHTEFYSIPSFDVPQAKILDEARFKLVNNKPFYSLVSLVSIFGHMTKEAQQYFAEEALCKDLIRQEVLIIDSLSIRILAKSYIKWIKPPYSIQLKKKYEDGLTILQNKRDNG